MSKFLAHDANFGRQIIKQMVHVTQPSVRINNLDSNLIEITVQFSFIHSVLGLVTLQRRSESRLNEVDLLVGFPRPT